MQLIKGMCKVGINYKYKVFLLCKHYLVYRECNTTKELSISLGDGTYRKDYLRQIGYEEIKIV